MLWEATKIPTIKSHVAVVKNINNVVVNSLFYKGLRYFEKSKNHKILWKKVKLYTICARKVKFMCTNLEKPYKP